MNKAARTSADHAFLPTEALPQAAREETKAETHVPSDPKNDPESEGAEKSNPEQHPEDCPVKRKSLPASRDANNAKRSKVDGSAIKSPALVLKTADIDWEAASGAESDSHDERENSPISSHKERGEVQVSLGEEELRQATLHFVKARQSYELCDSPIPRMYELSLTQDNSQYDNDSGSHGLLCLQAILNPLYHSQVNASHRNALLLSFGNFKMWFLSSSCAGLGQRHVQEGAAEGGG